MASPRRLVRLACFLATHTFALRSPPRAAPLPTAPASRAASLSKALGRKCLEVGLALASCAPSLPAAAAVSKAPVAATATTAAPVAATAASRKYLLFTGFPFPLGPFTERRTVQSELVKGRVYGFEQEIRLSGISANVRSTVFRTKDNHLVVYNPVAPTEEFLAQLDALGSEGVSHVLLGATTYEHKVFVGPFARKFPGAKVWAVPDQWSFPVDLPSKLYGIDARGSGGGDLVDTAGGSAAYGAAPDLTSEFEVKLLRPSRRLGLGYAASEAAVYHKGTKTLALTDALVSVPARPTPSYDAANLRTIGADARSAGTLGTLVLKGTAAVNWQGVGAKTVSDFFASPDRSPADELQRGWERNVLLSLFFGPSPESLVHPDPAFQRLSERWIVAPVTDSLVYRSSRVKPELRRWVDDVAKWDIKYISPSHFAAKQGTSQDWKRAFQATLADGAGQPEKKPFCEQDARLLEGISTQLVKLNVI